MGWKLRETLGDLCRSDSRLLSFSILHRVEFDELIPCVSLSLSPFFFFDGGKDIVYCILMSLEEKKNETNKVAVSLSSQNYYSYPTNLVNETSSSSSLQTHFRRPFFSLQNVTYPDRQMCWSTSLYSSSTNHHLYRVQLFSDTNTRRKIEALEKKKSPSLFGKVNLFGLPVGRGTLDRPPLIWRRTLSTCTETSALPRENFLLFFLSPNFGNVPLSLVYERRVV